MDMLPCMAKRTLKMIKLRNYRQGYYPGSCGWDQCSHKRGGRRVRIREENVTIKAEVNETTSQGMWAASKSWEKQINSHLGPPERT